MLEQPDLVAFSTAIRLPEAHVDNLTLRPLAHRYPPIRDALTRPRSSTQRPRGFFPSWLLGASTRFCPECLRGDGSEIQNRYGGPWQLHWRLAVVFACTRHNVFLHHLCPSCHQPVHSGSTTSQRQLIPFSRIGSLHPAQCRNPGRDGGLCGAWLNESTPAFRPQPSPQILTLQQWVLRLLVPDDVAPPNTAFRDLQVIAALVTATWPAAATVTPEKELTTAFTEYAARRRHRPAGSSDTVPQWTSVPSSPTAAAALIDTSTRLLNLPGPALTQALTVLFDQAPPSSSGWGATWTTLRTHCSPTFRECVNAAMPSQFAGRAARPARRRGRHPLILEVDNGRYMPEHIPQRIPDDWFAAMLGDRPHAVLNPSITLRRFTAVQLVQIANGMDMEEAARYLGIPDTWHRGFGMRSRRLHVLSAHQERSRPDALSAALTRLVRHVSEIQNHTNYHERRRRFADWTLSPATWTTIVRPVAQLGPAGRFRLGDKLRVTASTYIWACLTGSEWHLAPNEWTNLGGQSREWHSHHKLLGRITNPGSSPRYRALQAALLRHAEGLAIGR